MTSLRSSTSCGPFAGFPLQSSAEKSTLSEVAMPAPHGLGCSGCTHRITQSRCNKGRLQGASTLCTCRVMWPCACSPARERLAIPNKHESGMTEAHRAACLRADGPCQSRQAAARTQHLQLAPQLALLAADAVHDLGDVLEVELQLRLELGAVGALPHAPLVERHRAGLLQRLAVHLPPAPPPSVSNVP